MRVAPSHDPAFGDNRPCLVRFRDSREVDRVYVEDINQLIGDADRWKHGSLERVLADLQARNLPLEDVVAIEESPTRLPPGLANKIFAAGETGMGYFEFGVVLSDGRILEGHSGGSLDFLELPTGIEAGMISDVIPNRLASRPPDVTGAEYFYCLYSSDVGSS